jgi:hypothetical protein
LQLIFAKPSDLTTKIFFQKEILKPWHVENDISKPIVFELVINDSIDGPIATNNIPVCYHHNNAPIHNYWNGIPIANTIDIYLLKIYNPKRCVYSQPENHLLAKVVSRTVATFVVPFHFV